MNSDFIYVLKADSDMSYSLLTYNSHDMTLLKEEIFDVYNQTSTNWHYHDLTNRSNLESNFMTNKSLINITASFPPNVCSISSELFEYLGMNSIEIYHNSDQIAVKEVKNCSIQYSSHGENIFKIISLGQITGGSNVHSVCIDGQIYSGNQVLLIKDTF